MTDTLIPAHGATFFGAEAHIRHGDPAKVRAAMFASHPIMVEAMRDCADTLGSITAGQWRVLAPVVTGHYKASIYHTVYPYGENEFVAHVGNHADYADYVEEGTGIYGPRRHLLRPQEDDYLKFFAKDKGHMIRIKRSRGQKPQWVLRRAYRAVRDDMPTLVRSYAREAAIKIKATL